MSQPRQVLAGVTYMVTRRCIGRRFLLRPDERVNQVFLYCLARAAQRYGVHIHAVVVMSNHYHIIVTDVRGCLPEFMSWLNRHLALCVKKLRGWDEIVFEPNVPYSAVQLVSEEALWDKLAYVLVNPVSAALVRSVDRWPGVVTTLGLLEQGRFDAERPSVQFTRHAPERVTLEFALPPALEHVGTQAYLRTLAALVKEREQLARDEVGRQGRAFMGRDRVLRTRPSDRPRTQKKTGGRNPTFAAVTREARRLALTAVRAFRQAYRVAFEAWRSGTPGVLFPPGTWWLVRYAGAQAIEP